MNNVIKYTNAHGIVITMVVEKVETRTIEGRKYRWMLAKWHTPFGGWSASAEWHRR